MAKQLNSAQKRGLLVVLVALILVAGWRWRASQLADGPTAETTTTPAMAASVTARLDLNTADTTALQEIKGIGAASARRIVRYRELIGGFTSTDQLLKVWGITPENFIRIEEQVYADTTTAAFAALRKAKPQRDSYNRDQRPRFTDRRAFGQKSYGEPYTAQQPSKEAAAGAYPAQQTAATAPTAHRQLLDLNTADSLDLVSISGIGPSTARNILKYRSLIYFFDSVDQLSEVWGIRPENLERMQPYLTVGASRKDMPHLRINEMTVDEMGRHKYLGFKEARIIVAYRDMHGPFADMAALQKVQAVDPAKWEKLRPYLVF